MEKIPGDFQKTSPCAIAQGEVFFIPAHKPDLSHGGKIMSQSITRVLFIAVCLLVLQAGQLLAHGHHQPRPEKKGILLVAFGTTVPEAATVFKTIDTRVKKTFPGVEVRWAYTSKIIRHKLAKEGTHIDSPAEGLAKMMDDDFTHVAVQSLHTIPGKEYTGLKTTAQRFEAMPKGIQTVFVGTPLLYSPEDVEKAVKIMAAQFPKERKADEAIVLMGHGTPHAANIYYPALQYYFSRMDPNVFVGTVEGSPTLDDVLSGLKQRGITKAYLLPLMSVAGDHARNDMAGDEDDSWKSVLTGAGITCVPVLKGTGEYDAIVDLWIDHLKVAMAHL
ncbi:sirohydrochlorin cobaltochelatase [Desulfoplanes sp. PS50]